MVAGAEEAGQVVFHHQCEPGLQGGIEGGGVALAVVHESAQLPGGDIIGQFEVEGGTA